MTLAVVGQPLAPVARRAAAVVAVEADRLGVDLGPGESAVIAAAVLALVTVDASEVAPECTCELWGWCVVCRPGKMWREWCVEHDRPPARCSRLAREAFGLALFSNCEVVRWCQ